MSGGIYVFSTKAGRKVGVMKKLHVSCKDFIASVVEYGALVEWYWQEMAEVLGGKAFSVPPCPPQIRPAVG
jgi:hypothetical protein